jgi:small subunit ribosomal protein S8
MTMTDPIADFLTRLRNAANAQHHDVTIPSSKLGRELARILKEQGYIEAFEVHDARDDRPGQELTITLKYTQARKPVILGLQRVSRPGQRTYVDHAHIPRVQGGMGTAIISTSKGVMTGHDARIQGVGGEVVAKVW